MKKALVYGCGGFYKKYEDQIYDKFDLIAFLDKKETNEKNHYKLIDQVNENYEVILIMIEKVDFIFEALEELKNKEIDYNKIELGISYWGRFSKYDFIKVSKNGILISKDKSILEVTTPDEFLSVEETILNGCYYYNIPEKSLPEIVIDIGMNIGDSTMFFSNKDNVKKVYGFEPFTKTFEIAKKNLQNLIDIGKVDIFNIGLSDSDREEVIKICDDMSTGLSTILENTEKSREARIDCGLLNNNNKMTIEQKVYIKSAHEIVKNIMDSSEYKARYILKCDCEGEEYAIFEDLYKYNLLGMFSYIVVEWHNRGSNILERYLTDSGFSICKNITDIIRDRGIINAFKNQIV